MKDFVDRLAKQHHFQVIEEKEHSIVRISPPGEVDFELTIPHDEYEWFVTAKNKVDGKEAWNDWMEYYGKTQTDLGKEMERDIADFCLRLTNTSVRVIRSKTFFRTRLRLEWKAGNEWERLSLCPGA